MSDTILKSIPNLLHYLDTYTDDSQNAVNAIIEINSMTINKYELETDTGVLKLDRVGYSTLAYPFAYGAIPKTFDEDGDPLDVMITHVTEPLVPGSYVEARIIGYMRFNDGGEVDDKVICVLNDDKRMDHITSYMQLGEHWKKENTYYWEHYKDLKKLGTCKVVGYHDIDYAKELIKRNMDRYEEKLAHKVK